MNNATARVMTNKKVANPYTNGKGQCPESRGCSRQGHLQAPALSVCWEALAVNALHTCRQMEEQLLLPSAGVQPPMRSSCLGMGLLPLRAPWRVPCPHQLSLPTGWKLNPVVGAVYGPEFYAGNIRLQQYLLRVPPKRQLCALCATALCSEQPLPLSLPFTPGQFPLPYPLTQHPHEDVPARLRVQGWALPQLPRGGVWTCCGKPRGVPCLLQ